MRAGQSTRMLAGLVVGTVLGVAAHLLFGESAALEALITNLTEPIGRIFLRLLFMLVIPLVVSALALGVAELGDMRQLGRIGLKTLAYTVVVSSIAVFIGVALVNVVRPGEGLPTELRAKLSARAIAPAQAPAAGATGVDFLVAIDPQQRDQGDGRRRHAGGHGVRALPRHRPGADQDRGGARLRGRAAGTLRRRHAPARPRHPHRAGRRGVPAVHADGAPRLRRAAAARLRTWRSSSPRSPCSSSSSTAISVRWLGGMAPSEFFARCGRRWSPRSRPPRATPRCRPRCRWRRRTCTCRRR